MNDEPTSVLVADGAGVKPVGPFLKGVGQVEVAADAQPGMRQVRLVGAKKATTPRPFLVDPTPTLLDVEVADKKAANDRLSQAQRIETLPIALNGSLAKSQDIDVYRLTLKKGDCLVAASESRTIAAPTNLGVFLRDLEGRKLPLQLEYRKRDPVYWCIVPADGDYQLQLFEVTNNMGDVGEQTLYRLAVTTGPWLDYVLPAGGPRGSTARVTASGWNLAGKPGPGTVEASVPIPADAPNPFPVAAEGAPNSIPLAVGDYAEALEKEPNNTPEQAQPLSFPATINGGFQERGDVDRYRLAVRAKETLTITVEARDLDSYADVTVRILDTSGKTLISEDDMRTSRDPQLTWTARMDGDYSIEVRDLAGGSRGGPTSFYRLHVTTVQPRLEVVAREAVVTVKPGAKVDLPVTVFQLYQPGEVTLQVEGLPAGLKAEPVKVKPSPDRENSSQTRLVVTADAGAAPGFAMVRVIATTAGERPLTAVATWALTGDGGWTYGTGKTDRFVVLVPTP